MNFCSKFCILNERVTVKQNQVMIDRRIYHLCHEGLLFPTFWLDLIREFVVFFLSRTKNVDL